MQPLCCLIFIKSKGVILIEKRKFYNPRFPKTVSSVLTVSFMVTCQSNELGWEVTVELPADSLSIGRESVT